MTALAIIDSGGANIASLKYALERLGCEAILTREPGVVRSAGRVLLPGVGAAADAMRRLHESGLAELIPTLTQPMLGICLGMQLLFDSSEEGDTVCLGVVPGRARRFSLAPGRPVPHMGWNQLESIRAGALLDGVGEGDYAYFVHSYALPVGPATIATCEYGVSFSAAVSYRNFHGTQFHPERSAGIGARVLRNFLELG